VRDLAHSENTEPRVLRTSTWCSHVSHSPAPGRERWTGGVARGGLEDIAASVVPERDSTTFRPACNNS